MDPKMYIHGTKKKKEIKIVNRYILGYLIYI